MTSITTADHDIAGPVVSHERWLEARLRHLEREKALTRLSDEVARERRALPRVRMTKPYVFDAPDGQRTLADLFAGRRQLIVQHFMLGPGWPAGCRSCSFMADHADAMRPHLAARDIAFAAVSRAPIDEIERFRRRMGWQFPWVSSHRGDFNHDFHVSFTPEERATGSVYYNFRVQSFAPEEMPGVSVFVRDDAGDVFHTYSAFGRGVEVMMGTYRMIDLTPIGRDELVDGRIDGMGWVRHHDRYEHGIARVGAHACCGGPGGA
jgi:predicted dithiol-disulfide oxidoreductase (DUF899 family)